MLRSNYKKDTQKTTIVPAIATEETLTLAEEGAIVLCECPATAQLAALKQKQALVEALTDKESKKIKNEIASEMMEAGRALSACIAAVDAKVKALDTEAKAKFKADIEVAFMKECPEIASALK